MARPVQVQRLSLRLWDGGSESQLNHNHVTCIETLLEFRFLKLVQLFNACIACDFVKGGLMNGQMWTRTAKPCTRFALLVIEMDGYPT